jgi:hypothetical protein
VALNPGEIILKCNPAGEQWGYISNGVKGEAHDKRFGKHIKTGSADSRQNFSTPRGDGWENGGSQFRRRHGEYPDEWKAGSP